MVADAWRRAQVWLRPNGMQHAQLIGGIKRVTEALDKSGLHDALDPRGELPADLLLDALRRYAIAAAGFTSTQETVAELLGIADLENTAVWARLLADEDTRHHYYDRVGFVTSHLPRLVALLEESRQAPDEQLAIGVIAVGTDGGHGLLTGRLVTIVNSLTSLHVTSGALNGLPPSQLKLTSVDTGEDTALWFEGEAVGLGHLKQLLVEAFRWLALYREEGLEQRLERARDKLPIIEHIRALVADGTLDPDEATRLEQNILLALLAFFDAGAIIPEMERDIQQHPRDIVTPPPPSVVPGGPRASQPSFAEVADEIADLPDRGEKETVPPQPGSEAVIELEPGAAHDDPDELAPLSDDTPHVMAEPIDEAEVVDLDELEFVHDADENDFREPDG